jgi:hypothetical protein
VGVPASAVVPIDRPAARDLQRGLQRDLQHGQRSTVQSGTAHGVAATTAAFLVAFTGSMVVAAVFAGNSNRAKHWTTISVAWLLMKLSAFVARL